MCLRDPGWVTCVVLLVWGFLCFSAGCLWAGGGE
jgi:hypothetical protein